MDKGKEAANEEEGPLGLDEEDLTAIGLNPSTVCRGNDEPGSDNLLGRVVKSEDEAYRLYNEYAFEKGFSIRKGTTRYYEGTRSIRQKEYLCSKEGFKEDPTPCKTPSYNRLDVRTGCRAIIRFTVKDDEWKVTHFVAEHNHELASVEERHLLRSARNVHKPRPKAKSLAIASAEIALTENSGFVQRNPCNIEGQQKLISIEGGDAQSLFQWFKKKKNNDIMFFHDVQLDQEGRVTNLFWSDGKSRIDYGYFGDAIVFDSTYRVNKYNLICAPLFGINHHRGKVMFGCAFLLDESATSFIWLLKSFLECMGNKAPKTIITYQDDQGLIRAVEQVFPVTRHLLCPWHIARRASSHLVGLYSNTGFCHLFRKCTHHCDNELEFEQAWQRMMEEYDCRNNSWLKTIYRTRQQWSTAFSRNTFSCGLISSQKSESADVFNGTLSASKITSLTKFALEVDDLVARWRDSELKSNFRCKHGLPNLIIKKSSLCQQAAQIYTHKIFELFEQEYVEGVGAMSSTEVSSSGTSFTYHVRGDMDDEKVHIVHFDLSSTPTVSCSCKKFESMGILCSHCLSVLHMNKVKAIPLQYVLKRWTKNARECIHSSHDPSKETEVEYHTEMMRWVYDMITRSQKSPNTRTLFRNGFQSMDQELRRLEAELDSMTLEGNSSAAADRQKRKKNSTNESSKPKKQNELPVASAPFDSIPPSIQVSIGLPFFSPQYLQHTQFTPQVWQKNSFQRNHPNNFNGNS